MNPTSPPIIAIVDDDVLIGRSMAKLLVMMGFRAHVHTSGPDFLFSLGRRRPDCVLLDFNMPGTSGLQVMECLNGLGLKFPMIMATGSYDDTLWKRAHALGARSLMMKPYCVDDLSAKISQALGCPGFVPERCPWPCPLIGRGVWNCAFSGVSAETHALPGLSFAGDLLPLPARPRRIWDTAEKAY